LHLVQGVFMILVSNDTSYPIFTNFLSFDVETFTLSPRIRDSCSSSASARPSRLPADLRGGALLPRHDRLRALRRDLRRGMNPVRFYEYALSSSVMIVLIGMLTGCGTSAPSCSSSR
jgi:hypothetical protein